MGAREEVTLQSTQRSQEPVAVRGGVGQTNSSDYVRTCSVVLTGVTVYSALLLKEEHECGHSSDITLLSSWYGVPSEGVGLRARVEAGSWAVCCKLSAKYHSGITAVLQVVRMHAVYNICAG